MIKTFYDHLNLNVQFRAKKYCYVLPLIYILTSALTFAAGPCADDIQKFCKNVPRKGGEILRCLKEHDSALSESCKIKQQEIHRHRKEVRDACFDDIEKFCKTIKPGKGAIRMCMNAHAHELSASCKSRWPTKQMPLPPKEISH